MKVVEENNEAKPVQQLLFELTEPEDSKYSNTIELYDFIPKYYWGKPEREKGEFLRAIEREFECRGIKYKVMITPAKIKDRNGKVRDYYPSQREELIEDALRKLACEGGGVFLDDEACVKFSLYQLQRELKSMGHEYNIAQIKDALFVCTKTSLELTRVDGQPILGNGRGKKTVTLVGHIFEVLGLQTRDDWQTYGNKARAVVKFNILVTKSIIDRTFRQLNYEKCMSYRSVIARQLHKRLSHNFTQAGLNTTYEIMLTTIIRDFGLTAYARLRDNMRDVINALDEMVKSEVLLNYEVEKRFDSKRRNKISDVKFTLTCHHKFISEMIKANERFKRNSLGLKETEKTSQNKLIGPTNFVKK